MKILWYKKKYFDVDLDTATWVEMIKQMQGMGHQVKFVTCYKRKRIHPGIRITYVRSVPVRFINHLLFSFWVLVAFPHYCWSFKPDVIITDGATSFLLIPYRLIFKFLRVNICFVLDVRTLYEGWLAQRTLDLSLRTLRLSSDGITFITQAMFDFLSQKHPIISRKPFSIWASGVNEVLFDPGNVPIHEVNQIRAKFKADHIVLYHGSIVEGRGLKETVEAASFLKDLKGKIAIILLGTGKLVPELNRIIRKNDLSGLVVIHEPVPIEKVPIFIKASNVGILPMPDSPMRATSSYIKLLEYLAMNKPVIVTEIRAHRVVLNDAEYAIFVKSATPPELAKGILESYERRILLERSADQARRFVLAEYTWRSQAKRLLAFLASLKDKSSRKAVTN